MKLHQRLIGGIVAALLLFGQTFAAEQSSYQPPTSGPMSMATFVGTYLNPALRALATCNWGTTAPANGPGSAVAAQQCWWDTSGTPYVLKWYIGGQWVAMANINASTHVLTIPGLIIGTDVQAYDADLAALAANSTDGLWAHTGAGTGAARTLTAPAAGFTITNPAGIAGNPTFVLANDLAALEALSSTGFAARTTTDTWAQRTLQQPAAGFSITNPAGVAGDPTFALTNDLSALEGLSGTGIARRTGTDAWSVGTTVAVNEGGSGLTSGTSGGILCFTGPTTAASSALLTQYGILIGGGAGACPSAMAAGTDGQLVVAQSSAAPLWKTISGDISLSAAGAMTIGATKVTSAMLNADVFSTAHSWGGVQTLAAPVFTGTTDNQGTLKLSSFVTSTQITSNQNNYTATDGSNTCSTKLTLRVSSDASRNVSGLSCGQAEGDIRIVHNVGAQNVVLTNQDTNSTAANRFLFGGDMTLIGDSSVTIRYDGVASRWRAITTPSAGGGGGVTSATIAAGVGIGVSGTCTITTSGTCTVAWDDVYRQNALIDRIYQSKVFAGYRRGINAFADGYKASDGVNSGSSSNYTVDTSGGKVSNTTVSDSFGSAVAPTVNSNNTGWGGNTVRQAIASAALATLSGPRDKVRVTITPPTSGNSMPINKMYIGFKGTGAFDFDGAQVQVTFNGGSASVTATAGGSAIVSDAVTFAYDATKAIIIASELGATADIRIGTATGNLTTAFKASSADSATTVASGYSNGSANSWGVSLLEARTVAAATNSMTVVTTSQTADSTVTNGRVLLEYDNTATPTLNTDLTTEISCDNGSHWTSATLSAVTSNAQGGRKVAETADTACGTSGTSFAARLKALNNKLVPIYGTSLTVH